MPRLKATSAAPTITIHIRAGPGPVTARAVGALPEGTEPEEPGAVVAEEADGETAGATAGAVAATVGVGPVPVVFVEAGLVVGVVGAAGAAVVGGVVGGTVVGVGGAATLTTENPPTPLPVTCPAVSVANV